MRPASARVSINEACLPRMISILSSCFVALSGGQGQNSEEARGHGGACQTRGNVRRRRGHPVLACYERWKSQIRPKGPDGVLELKRGAKISNADGRAAFACSCGRFFLASRCRKAHYKLKP